MSNLPPPPERFKSLLSELFQLSESDLDFGIYRVMNQKRDEINNFINERIIKEVDDALKPHMGDSDDENSLIQSGKEAVKVLLGSSSFDKQGDLVTSSHDSPLGIAWRALNKVSGSNSSESTDTLRDTVFNKLYTFFSRYYDSSDFVCKQRYGSDERYAVPYNGSEVFFHWANKNQYYIKSSEYFARYSFQIQSRNVSFVMREVELEKDNNKGKKKRFFIPLVGEMVTSKNRGRVSYEIPFEYRALTESEKELYTGSNDEKKKKIIDAAVINGRLPAPLLVEEDGKPLLRKHIEKYANKHTADYFIHKDLGKFLCNELENFVLREVLNSEEMIRDNANTVSSVAVARAVMRVGSLTIDFLNQLENFQKALWEKKKFITDTQYCITLGVLNSNKDLLSIIVKCDKQWQEWQCLGFGGDKNLTKESAKDRLAFLKNHPSLMIDTSNFDSSFKDLLLASMNDLDEMTDGVLFHGENWQALNLMQERYRGQVRCVYIDPPYNTGNDNFLYRDAYKHSSWLSMLENRFDAAKAIMNNKGVIFCSLGDLDPNEGESFRLQILMSNIFPIRFGNLIWKKRGGKGAIAEKDMTEIHEYILTHGNDDAYIYENILTEKDIMEFDEVDANGEVFQWKDITSSTSQHTKQNRPHLNYAAIVNRESKEMIGFKFLGDDNDNGMTEMFFDGKSKNDDTFEISQKGNSVWPMNKETMKGYWDQGLIKICDGKLQIKKYLIGKDGTFNGKILKSILQENGIKIGSNRDGTEDIRDLFKPLNYSALKPKPHSLIQFLVYTASVANDIVLDYFSGSGTTAHAVININRKDGMRRKFILVEMGEHFDTVLLQRIKKIVFAPYWKDGKPDPQKQITKQEADRSPRIIKYHRFESYDDSLENIRFDNKCSNELLKKIPDYTARYMLSAESKHCATFADSKSLKRPFDYLLKLANAGEYVKADMPETFSYLVGMREKNRHVYYDKKRRYVVQQGEIEGKDTVVIWRDTSGWGAKDIDRDSKFIEESGFAKDAERILINDDFSYPSAETLTNIFIEKMFAGFTDEHKD